MKSNKQPVSNSLDNLGTLDGPILIKQCNIIEIIIDYASHVRLDSLNKFNHE